MARRSRKATNKRAVDFSNVGQSFKKDTDYRFKVKAAEWKDGNEHPYIAIELQGADDEYENSSIYHNASVAPKALARTREFLEALGADIDFEGETEIDCDELIGLEVMGTTYEDRYDGGKSIKVDEFWPVEDKASAKGGKKATKASGKKGKAAEVEAIDFDELSDADVKKLGKELAIKAKKAPEIREALADEDEDEVREAAKELGISLGDDAGEAEDGDIDFAELSDKDVKKLGKAMGSKKKDPDEIREDLEGMDADEVKEKAGELDIELTFTPAEEPEEPKKVAKGKAGKASSKRGSKKSGYSEDEVMEMSEEELEAAIAEHKLDVDLDDHKTLRKKKNAVIDALQAEDLITG